MTFYSIKIHREVYFHPVISTVLPLSLSLVRQDLRQIRLTSSVAKATCELLILFFSFSQELGSQHATPTTHPVLFDADMGLRDLHMHYRNLPFNYRHSSYCFLISLSVCLPQQ